MALEVGHQPLQVPADGLDVGCVEHLGPELADPAQQAGPLALGLISLAASQASP